MNAARRLAAALAAALLILPAARADEGEPAPAPAREEPAKEDAAKKEDATKTDAAKPDAAKPEPAKKEAAKAAPAKKKEEPKPAVAARRTPRSKREALAVLDAIQVSVNFDDLPLKDVVDHIAVVTGTNIVLGPALVNEGDLDLRRVTLRLTKVSVKQVLDFLVEGQKLGLGFRNGVLLVTTLKEARGAPVLRLYPASDFTMVIRDFPGPELMLRPSGAEFEAPEQTESKHPFGDLEEIVALIKDNTGTGTWEDDGVSASTMGEWIVVRQYPEVHEEVGRLLALLRSAR